MPTIREYGVVARIESKLDWPRFDMYAIPPCNPSQCSEKAFVKTRLQAIPPGEVRVCFSAGFRRLTAAPQTRVPHRRRYCTLSSPWPLPELKTYVGCIISMRSGAQRYEDDETSCNDHSDHIARTHRLRIASNGQADDSITGDPGRRIGESEAWVCD